MTHAGNITIPADVNVWPHELRTARALAHAGHDVRFVRKSDEPHMRTADMIMDGMSWEMKAPKSGKLKMVEQNLRRALRQSENVIFDSRRMKNLPDSAIERELRKWGRQMKSVRHLIYVNRHGQVIDIK